MRNLLQFAFISYLVTLNLFQLVTCDTVLQNLVRKASSRIRTITSEGSCQSNADCPSVQYCDQFRMNASYVCVPRLKRNVHCDNVGLLECESGLHCAYSPNSEDTTCLSQKPLGAKCDPTSVGPCLGYPANVCSRQSERCVPYRGGKAGEKCLFDEDCDQLGGFYCKSDTEKCTRKNPPGTSCAGSSDNFFCQGHCAVTDRFSDEGVCAESSGIGSKCSEEFYFGCKGYERSLGGIVCNAPVAGKYGTCLRDSQLISKLGAPCTPLFDRCDAEKSLSCRWVRTGTKGGPKWGRFACVQYNGQFCTPHSSYSVCAAQNGVPTECRHARFDEFNGYNSPSTVFPTCRRKTEQLSQGAICGQHEYATCKNGLSCKDTVMVKDIIQFRGPTRTTSYCVKILRKPYSDCSNPFRTKCREGFLCINGKCRPSQMTKDSGSKDIRKYAGVSYSCSELQCAPGLKCISGSCDYVTKSNIKKGKPCFTTARFYRKCEKGLVCRRNYKGQGELTCNDPVGVGGFCSEYDNPPICAKGLKCSEEGRCFNPTHSLNIGDDCNPKSKGPGSKSSCNVSPDGKTLSCRKNRRGLFVCHENASLFQRCDLNKLISCDSGLTCSSYGICVENK